MRFVVDVNNVIRVTENEFHVSYLKTLLGLLEKLEGSDVVCIADANIDHLVRENCSVEEQGLFAEIKANLGRRFALAPGGSRADEFILQFADSCKADVISNDRYREDEYVAKYPWIKTGDRLHKFSVISDVMLIPSLSLSASVTENNPYVCAELAGKSSAIDWSKVYLSKEGLCVKNECTKKEKEKTSRSVIKVARPVKSVAEAEPWEKLQPIQSPNFDVGMLDSIKLDTPWKVALGVGVAALAAWVMWDENK